MARTAQTAQGAHTASLCAEPEPEATGTPCTPPTEAVPQSRSARQPKRISGSSDSEEPLRRDAPPPRKPLAGQSSPRRSATADGSAQWPRLAAPWSGSPARNRPPPACPKLQDWSPETYLGKLALPGPFTPQLQPCILRGSQLRAALGASGGLFTRQGSCSLCARQVTTLPCPSPCRMDFAHMYQVYKSRRGIKRSEDSKVRTSRPWGPQPLARAVSKKSFLTLSLAGLCKVWARGFYEMTWTRRGRKWFWV